MKYFFLATCFLLVSCKEFGSDQKQEVDVTIEEPDSLNNPEEIIKIPEGALKARFIEAQDSLFAFVKEIDPATETTLIAFENAQLPEISIPESMGAQLGILKLKNFPNDVLLINAKLKDTNFNEYYLFVWKDSLWKQPVNRFDIHKSNMSDTLIPIINNPKDSTQLLRYYSVFDLDKTSGKKYTWRLMQESIPVEE